MARGYIDDAFKTAQEMGVNLTGFYTQKALIEARNGDDPSDSIAHARILLEDMTSPKPYVYAEIYPLIGTALALSGNEEAAKQQFATIYEAMEHMDFFDKFDVCIALAEALDESGFDAEKMLRECLEYAEAFLAEDPDFYIYQDNANQMKERAIEEMIERGYLAAAQENITRLSPTEIKTKAVLLAKLAVAEAKLGNEIKQRSQVVSQGYSPKSELRPEL